MDGILNNYRDMCIDIIKTLDSFHIKHVSIGENEKANVPAQQASVYEVTRGVFFIKERLMTQNMVACVSKSASGDPTLTRFYEWKTDIS
jgi:hypothetical protein